jgi:hypothetical protein
MAEAFVKEGTISFQEVQTTHDVDWFKKQSFWKRSWKCISKAEITVNKIWFHLMTSHHL